jgi:hypothetical protein
VGLLGHVQIEGDVVRRPTSDLKDVPSGVKAGVRDMSRAPERRSGAGPLGAIPNLGTPSIGRDDAFTGRSRRAGGRFWRVGRRCASHRREPSEGPERARGRSGLAPIVPSRAGIALGRVVHVESSKTDEVVCRE